MTTIKILRACAANTLVNGEPQPVEGPKEGRLFIGNFREENHPDNSPDSWGCIEIDTSHGTWVLPTDAVQVVQWGSK